MSEYEQRCRERLPAHLDENGDLIPPWAQFPDYERYTIGWRMGAGEDWMSLWHVFLQTLPQNKTARIDYLKRHAPAPMSWADVVNSVLSASDDDKEEVSPTRLEELLNLGVVASDVAFSTWLARQSASIDWPWSKGVSPESAARHSTRRLWFWSRQVASLRPHLEPPPLPADWHSCEAPLRSGRSPTTLDVRQGLFTLTIVLCAGSPIPPWKLRLRLADFKDSFDDDMGYVDAFRLWAMSCWDDVVQLEKYCQHFEAPTEWKSWLAEQSGIAL